MCIDPTWLHISQTFSCLKIVTTRLMWLEIVIRGFSVSHAGLHVHVCMFSMSHAGCDMQGCGIGVEPGVGVGWSRLLRPELESELESSKFGQLRLRSGVAGYILSIAGILTE